MLQEKLLKVCKKFSFQNFKNFNFKKYFKLFPLFLILIIIGLTLPQGLAHADAVSWVMDRTLFPILYVVFAILLWVGFLITSIGAYTLNATLNPAIINQVFASPAIYNGWLLIRDICNLLFLLLMLLVAFGTIVQSDRYNIKKSLPKLIMAVFLINFSNVIAGVIIDFGNILMYGILGWMCATPDSCFTDFTGGLMTVAWNFADQYSLLKLISLDGINSTQVIGAAIAMIYLYLYGFILLAMAGFLLIRTAALALILILAPFAYFGEVMPGMEKIASKWWSSIWSYTLFGPIFALMLYISSEIAKTTIAIPPITDPNLGMYSGTIVIIISNLLPLLFLVAVIPITKELGLSGTDTIMKNSTGLGNNIAKYAGGSLDRFVARGAKMTGESRYVKLRRGLSYASPGAWKRAIKQTSADQERDYDVAAGARRNLVEKATFGKTNIDFGKRAKESEAEVEFKTQGITNTDEMIDEVTKDIEKGINPELNIKRIRWLAAEGATDDLLERSKDSGGNSYERGPKGLSQFLQDKFDKSNANSKYKNLDDEHLSKMATDIHKAEKKSGNVGYAGLGKYDTTAKKYVFNRMVSAADIDDQQNKQVEAANSMDVKDIKKNSFINRSNRITDTGEKILANIQGAKRDRIKTWNRKDAEAIHKSLIAAYPLGPGSLPATKAELANTWQRIKTEFNL